MSMVGTMGSVWPSLRLRTLMDESVRLGMVSVPAWTGLRLRLPGGALEVYLGSQRIADAVVSWLAMRRGEGGRDKTGGAGEAVLREWRVSGGRATGCRYKSTAAKAVELADLLRALVDGVRPHACF